MIVYNTKPQGSPPIIILTKIDLDAHGEVIADTIFEILPGQQFDLSQIGLEPVGEK